MPAGNSSSKPLGDPRYKNTSGGLTVFQREQQFQAHYPDRNAQRPQQGRTEWDVLKENHRFIRDGEEPINVSWEERLARAYESQLFKEFALIDLKHYKSRKLALRWRTAQEVVEGVGEDTCGSLRCKHHNNTPPSASDADRNRTRCRVPELKAYELPFVYEEAKQRKEALVKVKLCPKCQAKLTWKPDATAGSHEEPHRHDRTEGDKQRNETAEMDDHKRRRLDFDDSTIDKHRRRQ